MVMDMSLLEIRGLETEFQTEQGVVKALRGIDYTVDKGEVLGIVGESGSGKSVGMLSMMGLLAPNGTVTAGEMIFDGEDISPVKYKTKKEKKERDSGQRHQHDLSGSYVILKSDRNDRKADDRGDTGT